MNTLYIRLPSRAADSAADWLAMSCPFALVSDGNVAHGKNIMQQGNAPLSALVGAIAQARRVVLLLAASDVTLLRIKVPPLSPARLKAALPNLVEDQIIGDPAECAIVAGGSSDGLRTVAVVQRGWLDRLARTLTGYGARQIAALPAQLCLPYQPDQPGGVFAAINEHHTGIDVALRLSQQEGVGLAVNADSHEKAAHAAINALCAVAPATQIALYVPQSSVTAYQDEISRTGNQRINVSVDNWSRWVVSAEALALDLLAGQSMGGSSPWDIRAWRWPLALSAAFLLINIAALNFDWLRMRREADTLRAAMIQTYKSAFPNETVIIDPIAQMQRKITAAKRDSGQAAPDDFTAIIAAFGEAWASIASGTLPAISGFEYRERSLIVRLKPGTAAPTQQMKAALAARNLSLELSSAQSSAVVWEIRSAR